MRKKLMWALVVEAVVGVCLFGSLAFAGQRHTPHLHAPVMPEASFTYTGPVKEASPSEVARHERRVTALYTWARKKGEMANLPINGDIGSLKPPKPLKRQAELHGGHALAHDVTPGSAGNALILDSTVSDGLATDGSGLSIEAQLATEAGFNVTEVSNAQWAAMTTAQFKAYRVLIVGDPDCEDNGTGGPDGTVGEATTSDGVWEPAVMGSGGNKVIVGTDPIFHYLNGSGPYADVLIQQGIEYAGAVPGATGVYLDLSCNFNDAESGTPVPILDGLSTHGAGQFSVTGSGPIDACGTNIDLVAATGPTSGLTDGDLSYWGCSVHEAFDRFPSDYAPLALAPSTSGFPASYCGTDVDGAGTVCGSPYILVSGTGVVSGGPSLAEAGGAPSAVERSTTCGAGDPVNCATGAFWHTFTDADVAGNGPSLDLTRTYSTTDAATDGSFGYGWTDSYGISLAFDGSDDATVTDANGSAVTFYYDSEYGTYTAPAHVLASFVANGDGTYTYSPYSSHDQYVFDSSGQLQSITDPNGYTETLAYSGAELTSVTDASGRKLQFAYSGGHVISVTDPAGNVWRYAYDGSGNLVSSTDPLGHSWRFTYDASHLLLTLTDPDGGTTTNTYDGSAQVVKQVDPLGRTTAWSFEGNPDSTEGGTTTMTDPAGDVTVERYEDLQLLSVTHGAGTAQAATTSYEFDPNTLGVSRVTDPNGNVTSYTYDDQGNELTKTDELGRVTTYTYNAFDERTSETMPNGAVYTWSYDANGNLIGKTVPLGGGRTGSWTYGYGSGTQRGDVTTATDPDGNATTYGYDSFGDLDSVTDPSGATTTAAFDSDGNETSSTTASGGRTTYLYDADNRMTAATDPLGHETRYAYDADGNRTAVTSPMGRVTDYTYDADNEETAVESPAGGTSTTSYDGDGNVTAQTDADGHTTTYTYTPLGEVAAETDADGATTRYGYDLAGNLVTSTDPDGRVTTYGYDGDNELVSADYSDGVTPDVTYAYDADGNRITLSDGTGTSHFTYSPSDQLVSETNGAGQTTAYAYDLAGNLTSITYPNGQPVSYQYNADGELTNVSDWLGNKVGYSYDADGNQSAETLPGGISGASTYDANGDITAISYSGGAGTLAAFSYSRDSDDELTAAAASGAAASQDAFGYDAAGRVTSDNGSAFGYDAAGNPTTYEGQAQTFDPSGALESSGNVNSTLTPASSGIGTGSAVAGGLVGSGSAVAGRPVSSGGIGVTAGATTTPRPGTIEPKLIPAKVDLESVDSATKAGKTGALTVAARVRRAKSILLVLVSTGGGRAPAKPSAGKLKLRAVTGKPGGGGDVEAWTTMAAKKGELTVSLTGVRGDKEHVLTVAQFAPGSRLTAHAVAVAKKGVPSLHLAPTVGSQVWAVGHDTGDKGRPKPVKGQQLVADSEDKEMGSSAWVQRLSVSKTGRVTIADEGRTAGWLLAAITVSPPASNAAAVRAGHMVAHELATGGSTFTYNAEGDRTSVTANGQTVALGYDQANRLVSVGAGITYAYDGDGLRTSETVNGATSGFVWDEQASTPLLIQAGSTYYIYGPAGQPIEQIVNGTPQFLLSDGQGSTRLITDSAGNVQGTYSYDAWGNVTAHSGTSTNLQYEGQYTDAETGFQYLRARYYDPTTGEFLTVDPLLPETGTAYTYADDAPTEFADPSGESSILGWIPGYTASAAWVTATETCNSEGWASNACSDAITHADEESLVFGVTSFPTGKIGVDIGVGAAGDIIDSGGSAGEYYTTGGSPEPYGPSDGTPLCVATLTYPKTTGIPL